MVPDLSRRQLLGAGAAMGSAVVLGACGDDEKPAAGGGGDSAQDLGVDAI
ncbi:MAG: hypothetical protein QOI45_725, partial [Thermoleophilaceae bacterium]|nr:hypothetical protein [Thermoleophilaceae bacterium]